MDSEPKRSDPDCFREERRSSYSGNVDFVRLSTRPNTLRHCPLAVPSEKRHLGLRSYGWKKVAIIWGVILFIRLLWLSNKKHENMRLIFSPVHLQDQCNMGCNLFENGHFSHQQVTGIVIQTVDCTVAWKE